MECCYQKKEEMNYKQPAPQSRLLCSPSWGKRLSKRTPNLDGIKTKKLHKTPQPPFLDGF